MADLVKLSLDQESQVCLRLQEFVDSGLTQIGSANTWWTQVERAHRNEMPSTRDILDYQPSDPGYSMFAPPFSQPRQDMLTAQVCTVVGKQVPYMGDVSDDEAVAEAKQQVLYEVWKRAGFEDRIRDLSRITGDTDLGFYRIAPGKKPGTVQINILHPRNVIVGACTIEGIQASPCVGHRFNKRRYEITSMQESGSYYKSQRPLTPGDPDDVGDPADSQASGVTIESTAQHSANDLINLWELVVMLDIDGKGERKYLAVYSQDDNELLSLQKYDFTYIWYFRSSFIGDPVNFYPSSSVGRNLYPLQDSYSKIWGGIYMGSMMSALKMTIGPKIENGEKFSRVGYASYVENDMAQSAFSPSVSFAGQPLVMLLNITEKLGDMVARISQNTAGAQAQGATTATEQSIIAAGVATGVEEYIAMFTEEMPLAAMHTMELIDADYDGFAERIGKDLPDITPDDIKPMNPPMPVPGVSSGVPIVPSVPSVPNMPGQTGQLPQGPQIPSAMPETMPNPAMDHVGAQVA